MSNTYLKNPFNYGGAKYKLLPQILPLFPAYIHRFVDLFGGSAEVSLNVTADKCLYVDKNAFLVNILRHMDTNFVPEVLSVIEKWHLSKDCYDEFYALRDYYNKQRNSLSDRENAVILYALLCHAFNYQVAFNEKNEYNMASGCHRSWFSPQLQKRCEAYVARIAERDITFVYDDFTCMNLDFVQDGDFFYADPPYLASCGVYERNFATRWSEDYEKSLLVLLDSIHAKHCRFALSNVLENKGQVNTLLLDWSKKYRVTHLNMTYKNCNYQTNKRTEKECDEVLITNY